MVLKQFMGCKQGAIRSEIKILSRLEALRSELANNSLSEALSNMEIVGLPIMLGFRFTKECTEILLAHAGSNMMDWMEIITQKKQRLDFAADMLRQGFAALKVVHGFGYSHGDIKPENMCARKTTDGSVKFTLIDFGVGQKLATHADFEMNTYLRGNLMFASYRQLRYFKATVFCDLIALVQMAFYFVFESVPSTERAR